MAKHELWELQSMQAAPLNVKIRMTEQRINEWIDYFGKDGVAISFSGGKDSTVLMDIIRNRMGYKDIPAVFVDVPTQFPELREFAKTWDNVEIIKPKYSFAQVCQKYGFPLITKEVSDAVWGGRRYLRDIELNDGIKFGKDDEEELRKFLETQKNHGRKGSLRRIAMMLGMLDRHNKLKAHLPDAEKSDFNYERHKYLLWADFETSNKCCNIMKKDPLHDHQKRTGRHHMTAQMASESRMRTLRWMQNGCNGFDLKEPISNPMAFWTDQDVLLYIKQNNLPICSVYGDIVDDWDDYDGVEGQMTFSDLAGCENMELFDADRPLLKTTGCSRTGCVLCGFGCHLNNDDRFVTLKESHPGMYRLLDIVKSNGVTMREAIEWINEVGHLNIRL